MSRTDEPVTAATSLGVIRVSGADAATFVHAQLTQNLRDIEPGAVRFGAWLDAQGRVLACLDIVATGDGIDLVTSAGLVEPLAKRLKLYVLRARCDVAPLAGHVAAWLGDGDGDSDGRDSRSAAVPVVQPGASTPFRGTHWYRIAPALAYGYPVATKPASDTAAAELAEIRLGRPSVGPETSGRFTAHMLNLDRLEAIAFDKGCYPGQEVVARTHHLGEAKRRMYGFVAAADAAPAPGDPVVSGDGAEVGTVIRSAPGPDGPELLAVVRRDALAGPLRLGVSTAPLRRLPVPGEPAD